LNLRDGVQHALFTKRDISRLLWPLVVEQILEVTVGMADVLMVSSVGEAAVSGVSLVDMINVLILNIFAAMATGGAVVVSQWLGAKEREKDCRSAFNCRLFAGNLHHGFGAHFSQFPFASVFWPGRTGCNGCLPYLFFHFSMELSLYCTL
jgi:Na+-driven multidrug efflux pump